MKHNKLTAQRWLNKAQQDIEAALVLLNSNKNLEDLVCFHAQQAAEKALKAFLVFKNIAPPKTHDINLLLTYCEDEGLNIGELDRDSLIELSHYAVEVRYPTDSEEIGNLTEEAWKAVKTAMTLKEIIENQILNRKK